MDDRRETAIDLKSLTVRERTILKLIFVDNISKVTLLKIFGMRYATFQNKLIGIMKKLC